MSRFKRAVGVIAAVLAVLLTYAVFIEPRFILDERREVVALPELPPELAGTEIAVFSDPQVGMWLANTGMVERIVETAVAAEPDAVLLAGDFVYSKDPSVEVQVDAVLELLQPLIDSGIPTFAVLGNHDYKVNAEQELVTALEAAGIPVLQNEALPLTSAPGDSGDALYIVGVGPAIPGEADVDAAFSGVPEGAPRVVLTHNPTVFPRLPTGAAPLTVAGHTHCGQLVLPGKPRWSYIALTEEEKTVADGWAPATYGNPGNRMFVTCGIGFSLVPARLNAPPQLVFFELVP